MLELWFRNTMEKSGQLKAKIVPETSEILCPICEQSTFKIFRRDKVSKEVYLNHCKCENCAQLFVYKVDKMNNLTTPHA